MVLHCQTANVPLNQNETSSIERARNRNCLWLVNAIFGHDPKNLFAVGGDNLGQPRLEDSLEGIVIPQCHESGILAVYRAQAVMSESSAVQHIYKILT
jgi:hypothetical protein